MMIKRSLLFFISTVLTLGAAFFLAGPELKVGQPTATPLTAASGSSSFLPLVMKAWPSTPTPTPTAMATRTPTATVTGTPPTAIPSISFPVGAGGSDVVPRQIVRTSNDRVYLFASLQYSTTIRAYWTTAAGLPNAQSDFNGFASVNVGSNPISVDAVYDGGTIIHVLTNTQGGAVKDYPFDTGSNTFKAATTIVSDSHTIGGDYVGSSGVSGMVDQSGNLHIAYWSSGNHIVHRAYTYNSSTNVLTLVSGPMSLDGEGVIANHPSVAVSPLDDSLTVAWVSQTSPARILARTRTITGTWSISQTVSTSPVWTSTSAGINIDQGPSLVIAADGTKHLIYMQDYDNNGGYSDYGRVHYVVNSGAGWTDQTLDMYTHAPGVAMNSAGDLYVLGHGHPKNSIAYGGGSPCLDMRDMCYIKMPSGGAWGAPQLLIAHTGTTSFDASPSIKWGVFGWNRPETVEFVFFQINNGDYSHPTLYYARLP